MKVKNKNKNKKFSIVFKNTLLCLFENNFTPFPIILPINHLSPQLQKKMEESEADIAKSLPGKLGSFTVTEISKAWEREADHARLEENFLATNAVLMDAERQQSQNEKIGFWLQKLREFMYDAEDALDEFEKASGEKYREHWQKDTPLLFKF